MEIVDKVASFEDGKGKEITFNKFRRRMGRCKIHEHYIVEKNNESQLCSIFYSWFKVRAYSEKESGIQYAMTYSLYDTKRKVVEKIGWCGTYPTRLFMYITADKTSTDERIAKRLFDGDLA